jgi:hypothetical protein
MRRRGFQGLDNLFPVTINLAEWCVLNCPQRTVCAEDTGPRVEFAVFTRGRCNVHRLINGWPSRPAPTALLSLELYVFRFLGLIIGISHYQTGDQHGSNHINGYFPDFHENYTQR